MLFSVRPEPVEGRSNMTYRYRDVDLMSVRGPTAAILSFAPPKESIQRKGGPDAVLILPKPPVLGAA
ncbi:MAG: hypothetical protein CTY19_12100 [Methylomonas sp.]|nr:MAG: hypothetical protein CTY19_12100 [Methylomonas sp.]